MRTIGRTTGSVLAGLLCAGFLIAAGPSVAGAAVIKVNAPGNSLEGVDLSTSSLGSKDVVGVSYPLSGGGQREVTGWSLRRVLEVAAAEPGAAGWLDAARLPSVSLAPPSTNVGAQISVSSNEIVDQGIFGGGRTPVFVENDDGSVTFIKPGVNGTPGAAYRYVVSVEIRVEKSRPVSKGLGLKVSPRSVDKGEKVSLAVTVPGRSASGLRFTWKIREAASGRLIEFSSRGGLVTRAFERKGSYTVLVALADLPGFVPAVGSFTVGSAEGRSDTKRKEGTGAPRPPAPSSGPPVVSLPPSAGYGSPTPGLGGVPGTGGDAGAAPSGRLEPPPESEPREEPIPDGLEQVSGELIGPDVEVVEVPPEAFAPEGAGPSGIDEGPGFLGGAAGEAATLLGVGLLLVLGGLIETRLLSRRS